eukprot:CAMPEP_0185268220 /NCGR_PEP_ID=MMETSP1359-20130426/36556_1 /TAXON_ID=552665 /ORGANISM="Bigelowiella longifila, Strain CCMP242" /LENGTH=96 /DNA_ID=CAMNT_0027858907 /DNA_START=510 /DNA_END=797 /DNA_ORIENTATION=+
METKVPTLTPVALFSTGGPITNEGLMTLKQIVGFFSVNSQAASSASLLLKRYGPLSTVESRFQSSSVKALSAGSLSASFCGGPIAAVEDVTTIRGT